MAMKISGIASGLDTDSMVQELVKAASTKKEDLEKAQKKLEWKQESWKDLNAKVYSFFNDQLSNMSLEGSYIKKKTSVADSNIASVIAGDTAVNGTQSLAVKKLAKAGSLTGGKLSNDKSVKSTTTLSDLAGKTDTKLDPTEKVSLRVNVGGKEQVIELRGSSTIDDVLSSLKKVGLTASFDEANQRIFLFSSKTGVENDFTITAGNMNGLNALNNLGLLSKSDLEDADNPTYQEYQFWAEAFKEEPAGSGQFVLDEDIYKEKAQQKAAERASSMMEDMETYLTRVQELREERSKLSSEKDLRTNFNQSQEAQKQLAETALVLKDYYQDIVNAGNKAIADQQKIVDQETDPDAKKAAEEELNRLTKLNEENRENLRKASEGFGVASSAASSMGSTLDIEYDENGSPVAPYNLKERMEKEHREFAEVANKALHGLELTEASKAAARVVGSDAIISVNGADFTSDSNTITVNGMTITANAESAVTARDAAGNPTSWAETSITTADDVDGIYDMVKDFFKKYNELIKEMDTLYNAETAKGYEPLTDEEKDALSDTEVEQWEKKIKDSLLRRDGDLSKLINIFKTTMLGTHSYNGKEYSLSSFGINTLSYFKAPENERGVFHIDGDEEDSNSSANANALKAAIASDPQAVTSFFSQLIGELKGKVQDVMDRTDYRSMYKVYDDKRLQKEYDEYKSKIKDQEKKLQALEDRYYNQFTQMEKALSKLNSQQSYLSSLFGG